MPRPNGSQQSGAQAKSYQKEGDRVRDRSKSGSQDRESHRSKNREDRKSRERRSDRDIRKDREKERGIEKPKTRSKSNGGDASFSPQRKVTELGATWTNAVSYTPKEISEKPRSNSSGAHKLGNSSILPEENETWYSSKEFQPKPRNNSSGALASLTQKQKIQKFGNSSVDDISYSPENPPGNSSLKPPAFVTPSRTSDGLPSGGRPAWRSKYTTDTNGLGSLPLSNSTEDFEKSKSSSRSGKSRNKNHSFRPPVRSVSSSTTHSISSVGSPSTSPSSFRRQRLTKELLQNPIASSASDRKPMHGKKRDQDVMAFLETPDIKIEVKIPNIEKKMRARRVSNVQSRRQQARDNVPEWKLKFQQREATRIRREHERQATAASRIQALVIGWKARKNYPKLLRIHADRLQRMREREEEKRRRIQSAVMIQKGWRGVLPRKRFLYVREKRRLREKNQAEIDKIEKALSMIPKMTKASLKEMKKECAEKRKQIKKDLKKKMKEEEKKLEEIKKSGHGMIDFLKGENGLLKQKQEAMKNEYKVLEKQFDVLAEKSDEISRNFSSLQRYVDKKNASIKKREIDSHKCRHRYLPKYRGMLKERDKQCIIEHRIGELYKNRLKDIVKLLVSQKAEQELVGDALEALTSCEAELGAKERVPVPSGLKDRL